MSKQPSLTELVRPPINTFLSAEPYDVDHKRNVAAAASEAAQREMAMLRDLNRHPAPTLRPDMVKLRQPRLSDDHAARVEKLDQQIHERGVPVSRDGLLSLGKARFNELLAADRVARSERVIAPRCDLTGWASVFYAFAQSGLLDQIPVPARSMAEQYSGAGADRDLARKVEGFADLWKFFGSEPRAIRAIYAFRALFECLLFGQSLLTWIDDDGLVHHRFFCGRGSHKAGYFETWLPTVKGAHYRVSLTNVLQSVVFWLAGERDKLDVRDLACKWFGVCAPSQEQITLATAILEGWLLNYEDWDLWQHVGSRIRRLPDNFVLEQRREELRKRFDAIDIFYRQLRAFFWKAVGTHQQFDAAGYRAFLEGTVSRLLDCVSHVAALTVEENSPPDAAPVIGRFKDWLLCQGKPKANIAQRIQERLSAVFTGARFHVTIEEAQ